DAWTTLAALAARTSRIRLGTLVSPATFRHPSVLAKSVATVDHVSGGRVELGLGAGWHEGEHRAYGFEFPPTPVRMERLAEQLELVTRSWTEEAFSFSGRHYQVQDLRALPKPVQRPRPTLLVGGGAGPRSLALAARFADEYNTTGALPDELPERRRRLLDAWREAGRDPETARFSLMATCVVGRDRAGANERAPRVGATPRPAGGRGGGWRGGRPGCSAPSTRWPSGSGSWRRSGSAGSCSSTWIMPTPRWSRSSAGPLLPGAPRRNPLLWPGGRPRLRTFRS